MYQGAILVGLSGSPGPRLRPSSFDTLRRALRDSNLPMCSAWGGVLPIVLRLSGGRVKDSRMAGDCPVVRPGPFEVERGDVRVLGDLSRWLDEGRVTDQDTMVPVRLNPPRRCRTLLPLSFLECADAHS